jgi:type II secretory pathway component GspD/PulD (secretin)
MPKLYSKKNNLLFFLIIIYLLKTVQVFAEDAIEIDLGSNPQSNSKASQPSKQQTVNIQSGKEIESNAKNKLTYVGNINIKADEKNNFVEIKGMNLSKPSIEKTGTSKLLLKFLKTDLRIPKQITGTGGIIKSIRSSIHGTTAWIVLDVNNNSLKYNVQKITDGYSVVFSDYNAVANNKEKSLNNISGIGTESDTANVTSDKKGISRLIDSSIKPLEKGVQLILTLDGSVKYTVRKLAQPEKLVIRFHDTKLNINEKSKKFQNDDVELQKGGLLLLEMRQIGPAFSPISEAILTLAPGTTNQIDRDLNQIVITLTAPARIEKLVEKRGNINQLVTMDIESADINAVLKTLASEAGFDVDLVNGNLAGTVNEKFKSVPLKTVLAVLLSPGGYDYELQGNTIRIGPQATIKSTKAIMPHVTELLSPSGGMTPAQFDSLVRSILKATNAVTSTVDPVRNVLILNGTVADIEDYKNTIKDLKLDESTNSDRITRIVKLNYADPGQMIAIMSPYLTPVGKVQSDPRTNNLIIWEVASNMGVLLELIKEVDVKSPQVLIESNIIELDTENDLDMGVNWNVSRSVGDPTINGSLNQPPISGNNPGAFTFGTLRSGVNISATLQALETHKMGKIISRPRIATASGIAAEINVVENIVYATTAQSVGLGGVITNTTTYTTLPLPVDLKVTPRINDDGRITTIINANITSQSGPAQPSAPPPTTVESATTTLTTKNGETIVIGGLVREISQDTINGVPLLSSIPIIGTLFQEHDKQVTKAELIIFITPTVIED